MAQRRIKTKESIKRKTVEDMKQLGTYKPQYNQIIDIYAELVHQYLRAVTDFEKSGYEYEVPTGTGSTKKSGIVSTMENLRKDILAYSDRLCLNPKSLENVTAETNQKSLLTSVLKEIG